MSENKPKGRPTKYRPEFVAQVYKLGLLGSTNKQLADFFDVNVDTIHEWRSKHKRFSDAITKAKKELDNQVVKSLFHRAMGYTHPEEKISVFQGEVTRVDTKKHYPPDTNAAIFWLKNRQPEVWRDRVQTDITNSDGSMSKIIISEEAVKIQHIMENAAQTRSKQLKGKVIDVEPELEVDSGINEFI